MATTALRRGFLAVVPPPAVLRWIESVADSARGADDGLRWTRTGQRHLTLQFLGPVAEPSALADSVAESVRRIAPFSVALGGAGAFPNARRGSVLWLGVRDGADELAALAASVTDATASHGFVADDRPFRAHLTLARVARSRDLRAVVTALDECGESERWTVDEVVLFESDTRAGGAVHTAVTRFGLAG